MDDLALPQHHRSGAHRARRHPLLGALVTVGAVAAASALLLWGLLAFDVLGVGDDLREAGGGGPATGAATAEPSTAGSGTPGAVPSGAVPSGEASSGEAAVPSTPGEPSPVPPPPTADRSLPLTVLNSTSTPGLAAAAAEALGGTGWQVDEVGNFDGDEIPTAVLYPEAAGDGEDPQAVAVAAATAAEVAVSLGVGVPTPSSEVDVLTVVLGPDYEP